MPFREKGNVRIHYEEAGSGFPLLVIPGGGLNSVRRQSFWDSGPDKLREALAHRGGAVRPPAGGAASDGWQWCVV
jgi:hypothetical protein